MRSFSWRPGFTTLEALIAVAFVGLLVTFGAFSINNARARARDAVRVSDVNTLRAALNVYWQQKATYPTSPGMAIGQPGTSDILTLDGFVALSQAKPPVLLQPVPADPSRPTGYWYKGGPNGYAIRFETERDSALGQPNVYYLHSTGFDTSEDPR